MSTAILPFATWDEGSNQARIPANDNSLRLEALSREIISQAVTAQPGSPTDGDTYIIAATHTGSQWAGFSPKDIAIYRGGTWYAWAPVEGLVVNVAGSLFKYDAGAWTAAVGGSGATELRGLTFTSDTGSTADSDPGAGLFKWNNATQGSATQLFFDNSTADGVSLATFWAGLAATGYVLIVQGDDATRWQLWKWSSVTDGTGYRKLAVALQGTSASAIVDDKLCYCDFDADANSGGAVSSVNGVTGAVTLGDLQETGLNVDAVGFRGIPINSQSGNYTTVAADSGKALLHPSGGGAGDTFTIDSNANVAYEVGTAITFINMDSNALSIAITSDTMNLAGAGTTGTRTLAQYGIATALKVTSTGWLISGTNLT